MCLIGLVSITRDQDSTQLIIFENKKLFNFFEKIFH